MEMSVFTVIAHQKDTVPGRKHLGQAGAQDGEKSRTAGEEMMGDTGEGNRVCLENLGGPSTFSCLSQ